MVKSLFRQALGQGSGARKEDGSRARVGSSNPLFSVPKAFVVVDNDDFLHIWVELRFFLAGRQAEHRPGIFHSARMSETIMHSNDITIYHPCGLAVVSLLRPSGQHTALNEFPHQLGVSGEFFTEEGLCSRSLRFTEVIQVQECQDAVLALCALDVFQTTLRHCADDPISRFGLRNQGDVGSDTLVRHCLPVGRAMERKGRGRLSRIGERLLLFTAFFSLGFRCFSFFRLFGQGVDHLGPSIFDRLLLEDMLCSTSKLGRSLYAIVIFFVVDQIFQQLEAGDSTGLHATLPCDFPFATVGSVSQMVRRRFFQQRPVAVQNPGLGQKIAVHVFQDLRTGSRPRALEKCKITSLPFIASTKTKKSASIEKYIGWNWWNDYYVLMFWKP